jgi:iron complex outermembrane receptor protein
MPNLRLGGVAVLLTASPAFAQNPPIDSRAEQLDTVQVTASADASAEGLKLPYAGGQVARGGRVGIFGSLDNMSTPFSITSYTQKLITDQQAASVGDVLQNDPAVRVARGFGNFQQTYIVRGLPVFSDDMSYNGLYGLLPRQYLATEVVERVEVLRGASAFLNGAAPGGSGLGGAINVMPKRAPNTPINDITVGLESGAQSYVAADLARRFGPDDSVGLRLNYGHRNGGTAVDGENRKLDVLSLGFDYRNGDLRVSADVGYQDHRLQRSQPSVTIASTLPIPSAPDASRNLGQPWTFSDERDTFATVRAEYDLTSWATAWIAADGTMNALRFDNRRIDNVATGEVGLRMKFDTAGVQHNVVASLTGYSLKSKNAFALSDFGGFNTNLNTPSQVAEPVADAFVGGRLDTPLLTARTRNASAAVADMVGLFNDRLLLTGGARYQRIAAYGYDFNTGAQTSDYSKGRATPVGGVLFKVDPRLSLYANYIEGLVQGDVASTTFVDANGNTRPVVNAGQVFRPDVTRQVEVGAKVDLGRFGSTIDVFESRKPLASVDIATGTFAVNDHQRNRGVEWTVFGEPIRSVRLLGGATYLDTDVTGKDAIGSPRFQFNANVEWDIPGLSGLTVDARAVHTTSQFADAANTQRVPGWTRFDAGLRYAMEVFGRDVTLRGRVENLANRNQWVSVGGFPGAGYLVLGNPRTFLLSGTVGF